MDKVHIFADVANWDSSRKRNFKDAVTCALASYVTDDFTDDNLANLLQEAGVTLRGRTLMLECVVANLRTLSTDGENSGLEHSVVCYMDLKDVDFAPRLDNALKMMHANITCEGKNIINHVMRSSTDECILDMGPENMNRALPSGLAGLALVKIKLCDSHSHLANSPCPNSVGAPRSNKPADCATAILAACKVNGDGETLVNAMILMAWIDLFVTIAELDVVNLLMQCWELGVHSMDDDGSVWIDNGGPKQASIHYWDVVEEKMKPTFQRPERVLCGIVMPWMWEHCDQRGNRREDVTLAPSSVRREECLRVSKESSSTTRRYQTDTHMSMRKRFFCG